MTRLVGPLLLVGITVGLGLAASDLRPRYQVEDFFAEDAPERAAFNGARASFGRDDRVAAAVYELPAPATREDFARLHAVALALGSRGEVEGIISPTTAQLVTADDRGRPVLRPAVRLPFSEAMTQLGRRPFVDRLLSADRRVAVVGAVMRADRLDFSSREALRDALATLSEGGPVGARVRLVGYPVHRVILTETVAAESRRLYPLVLLALALVLAVGLRSVIGVVAPLVVAGLAAVWTTGLMAVTGLAPNILSPGVYVLVAVIGVADAVHVLCRQQWRPLLLPCGLGTLTTGCGFAALWLTGIPMVAHFGIQVAMGVASAYAITFLLLPSLLPLVRAAPPRFAFLDRLWRWTLAHRRAVLVVSGLLLLGGAAATTQVRVDSPLLADLSPDHPVREAYAFLDDRMGGVIPIDLLVTAPEHETTGGTGGRPPEQEPTARDAPNALYARETIDRVATLAARLREDPDILSVSSVSDLLGHLGPLLRRVPADEVNGLLPTALLLANDETRTWVDDDAGLMRLRLRVRNLGTAEAFALHDRIDGLHRDVMGTPATLTGQGVLSQTVNRRLVDHFRTGFLVALGLVVLVLLVALRRPRLALLALLPNLLPLAVVVGTMGLWGIDLRYTSALVLTVVFALAVDDTIHMLTEASRAPLEVAYRHAAPGIWLTSVVLAVGFGILMTSEFLPNRVMGLLLSVCAVSAVVADLILLPALLGPGASRTRTVDAIRRE